MDSKVIDVQGVELRKYQLEVLKIAKDFSAFCETNNIFYTLSGGSVLGAIRHGGFIPWDDDIDINMPRKDYDKFIGLLSKEFKNKYYVQTPVKDSQLGLLITQIRKKGTVARRKYDMNNKNCGISIDVYIMENVSENRMLYYVQMLGSLIFPLLVSINRTFKNRKIPDYISKLEHRKENNRLVKRLLGRVVGIFPIKPLINASFYFFKMCKDENSKYISLPTGRRHFNGEMFLRDDLCKSVNCKFEDTYFRIPHNYETYLTQLYGDYMVMPDKRHEERHLFLELKY